VDPAEATSGFSSNRKTIDIPPVRRYCSGQKRRWFKIPIQTEAGLPEYTLVPAVEYLRIKRGGWR
jgi:hypothetical protein